LKLRRPLVRFFCDLYEKKSQNYAYILGEGQAEIFKRIHLKFGKILLPKFFKSMPHLILEIVLPEK